MIQLTKEELVLSIVEQTERSAAVIGHTDLDNKNFDPTTIIVSSLSNIFDSALVVLALENISAATDECYKSAYKVVMATPSISSEQKEFMKKINTYRCELSLDSEFCGNFKIDRCLDFLNSYDCFMYQFFQKSITVKEMKSEGKLNADFISFHNILNKLAKKNTHSSNSTSVTLDINSQLNSIIDLLKALVDENNKLNQKIDYLNSKLLKLSNEKGVTDE